MTFYSFIYVCFPKTCSAVVLSPVRVTGMCVFCARVGCLLGVQWIDSAARAPASFWFSTRVTPVLAEGDGASAYPCHLSVPLGLPVFALHLLMPLLVCYTCTITMPPRYLVP